MTEPKVSHQGEGGGVPSRDALYRKVAKKAEVCIDYLIDNNGLIEIRAKERTLRLLDPEKSKSEKSSWQWFSMILPILSIFILGIANYFIRRKRYI